jgi:hypothetical protein
MKEFLIKIVAASLYAATMSAVALPVSAQDLGKYEGSVGSFTNDYIGDGHDRWMSASYQRSYFFDRGNEGLAEAIEIRGRAQIVSPWSVRQQSGQDRPYSSALGLGGFAHGHVAGFETRFGGEIILQGDQTGLPAFQHAAHEFLGLERSYDPNAASDPHVKDKVTGRFEAGLARSFRPNENVLVRPYTEIVAGADEYAAIGSDLVIGSLAGSSIWSRDVVTGQILTHQSDRSRGMSFLAGADVRKVSKSLHIPESSAVEIEDTQVRARLGVHMDLGYTNVFFGQTWLSEGFQGQSETQRLGTLSISLNF